MGHGNIRQCMARLGRLRRAKLAALVAPGDASAAGKGQDSDHVGQEPAEKASDPERMPTSPVCSVRILSRAQFTKHVDSCNGAKESLDTLGRAVTQAS